MNKRNPSIFKKLLPLWVLIAINVLVFISIMVADRIGSESGNSASSLFELSRSSLASQPWTIISAMFVHIDWAHLMFNMIALFVFGMYVLPLIGELRFFMVYFIGGLVGNAFFLLLADPIYVVVGASGAVLALGGVLAVLAPRLKVVIFPIPFPMDLWIAILILALLSFLQIGVAWQAHVGGLIVGLIAGYLLRLRPRLRPS